MVAITQETLQGITQRLVRALRPQQIYLFGSRAYGSPRSDSDVDLLLVIRPTDRAAGELSLVAHQAIGDVGCGVDVVIRTVEEFEHRASWPSNFEATVKAKGRLLHEG